MLKQLNNMPMIFNALGDSTRFRIFQLLLNEDDLCVSEIAHELGISVPAVSQQFRILEFTGLVEKKRVGRMICYRPDLKDRKIGKLVNLIKKEAV